MLFWFRECKEGREMQEHLVQLATKIKYRRLEEKRPGNNQRENKEKGN